MSCSVLAVISNDFPSVTPYPSVPACAEESSTFRTMGFVNMTTPSASPIVSETE